MCFRAVGLFLQLFINLSEALETRPVNNRSHNWMIDSVHSRGKHKKAQLKRMLKRQNKLGYQTELSPCFKNKLGKYVLLFGSLLLLYCLARNFMLRFNYVQPHTIY